MDLFPAIDIRNGRSVRLVQGDFSRETVYGDPVERAEELLSGGARFLHVVDLDAAVSGVGLNREVVFRIAGQARVHGGVVQVGGGVRDESVVTELLSAGAARVVIGTAALGDPELVAHLATSHPGSIVIGLDYLRKAPVSVEGTVGETGSSARLGEMMLATDGWTSGGTVSMEDALTWFEGTGVAAVVVTDIGRDGTLDGPDLEGLSTIMSYTEIPVLASGGISSLDDLVALRSLSGGGRSLAGAIVGRALLQARFSLGEALEVCA